MGAFGVLQQGLGVRAWGRAARAGGCEEGSPRNLAAVSGFGVGVRVGRMLRPGTLE